MQMSSLRLRSRSRMYTSYNPIVKLNLGRRKIKKNPGSRSVGLSSMVFR